MRALIIGATILVLLARYQLAFSAEEIAMRNIISFILALVTAFFSLLAAFAQPIPMNPSPPAVNATQPAPFLQGAS